MRLVEFAGDAVTDLQTALRNIQGQANTHDMPAEIPWEGPNSISQLMNPLGYEKMDLATFQSLQKQDPEAFNNIVQDANEDGIILKTSAGEAEPAQQNTPDNARGKSVDQMAHNVVSKDLT